MMQGGDANAICSETRQDEVGSIGVAYGWKISTRAWNESPKISLLLVLLVVLLLLSSSGWRQWLFSVPDRSARLGFSVGFLARTCGLGGSSHLVPQHQRRNPPSFA